MLLRRAALTLTLACLAALLPTVAHAAKGDPGDFTGYAFDSCSAPEQEVMDAWWEASPYAAVGIYLGGSNRLCDQPNLTADWVRAQQRRGWRLLPIWVGPQASCTGYSDVMSSGLTTANSQGRAQAREAVATAKSLGIARKATLYYDLEDYDLGPDDCRRAALSFVDGWTRQLHSMGYRSGVYSNIAAAITSLDYADRVSPGTYAMPDDIWFAWENGRVDVRTDKRVLSDKWDDHDRIHQYALDVTATHGGQRLVIDSNWADVGRGSTAPRLRALCRGVDVDLRRYPTLRKGRRGPAVEALQCALRASRLAKTPITGTYDARTIKAVKKAQRRLDLKPTGRATKSTWTGVLSRGSDPTLKVGHTGKHVARLQRSLVAALGKRVTIDGVYSRRTESLVKKLQRKRGLEATGVTTADVWSALSR